MARLLSQRLQGAAAARMSDVTAQTLVVWASLPFIWGATDCFLSVLDHVETATGCQYHDRPRYRTALQAERILKRHGGFRPYCEIVFGTIGLITTDDPVRGDVGLVDIPGTGLTACLCLGRSWAARGDGDVTIAQMRPEVAWRVVPGTVEAAGVVPCPSC